jgi:hypothetical protein
VQVLVLQDIEVLKEEEVHKVVKEEEVLKVTQVEQLP